MGLELKPSKTRIVHSLWEYEGNRPGFDFLGTNIRQYPVGKTHSGRNSNGKPLGFVVLTKPSKDACKRHIRQIGDIIRERKGAPQEALVARLNPLTRGWALYHRAGAAARTFRKIDHVMYRQLRAWGARRHPDKSAGWVARRYWHARGTRRWNFGPNNGATLLTHGATHISRHTKVRGDKSFFDGDWAYWAARTGAYPGLRRRVARLLRLQQGRCAECGLYFTPEDIWEVDHIWPTANEGPDWTGNTQLLHGHCHDRKSARDHPSHVACGA
jgi:RNA-directed DNA polymerase